MFEIGEFPELLGIATVCFVLNYFISRYETSSLRLLKALSVISATLWHIAFWVIAYIVIFSLVCSGGGCQ